MAWDRDSSKVYDDLFIYFVENELAFSCLPGSTCGSFALVTRPR